mmetsp:Transcript_106188/g.307314  ORF Transcript_106188/g.307314 Transcript_106188/m.307314 type:complete len:362 (-) Transcript_106188:1606-2691(-)
MRPVMGDAHPILDDLLLVLSQGHDLCLVRPPNTVPIHELRGAWPQDVVADNDGPVGQQVEAADPLQIRVHLRALLIKEQDVDRLLRQAVPQPWNQVLAVADPDLDVVREPGPLNGVPRDHRMKRVDLHGDHSAAPLLHLRGHPCGGVANIEADLDDEPWAALHGEHGVEHRALLVAGQLQPELLLLREGLDRLVYGRQIVLPPVPQDVVHRAHLLVVLDLVQPQAEAQRVRDPLVLFLLPPPPLDRPHDAPRRRSAATTTQVLRHRRDEALVVHHLQRPPRAVREAMGEAADDGAVPSAGLKASRVRGARHLLQDIHFALGVLGVPSNEQPIAVRLSARLDVIRGKAVKQRPRTLVEAQAV